MRSETLLNPPRALPCLSKPHLFVQKQTPTQRSHKLGHYFTWHFPLNSNFNIPCLRSGVQLIKNSFIVSDKDKQSEGAGAFPEQVHSHPSAWTGDLAGG